jgi:hypothetical protein
MGRTGRRERAQHRDKQIAVLSPFTRMTADAAGRRALADPHLSAPDRGRAWRIGPAGQALQTDSGRLMTWPVVQLQPAHRRGDYSAARWVAASRATAGQPAKAEHIRQAAIRLAR